MSQRKHYLFVCTNRRDEGAAKGSCAARGAAQLHAALKERLKETGLAELEARACTASCLDVCWVGPVVAVFPDNFSYGRVQLSDVDEIVEGLRTGQPVERLVLRPEEFLEPREQRAIGKREP